MTDTQGHMISSPSYSEFNAFQGYMAHVGHVLYRARTVMEIEDTTPGLGHTAQKPFHTHAYTIIS